MNSAEHNRTFQDDIRRRYVLQTIHARRESNEMRSIVRVLEPAPQSFFGIVSSVKSGLVRLAGMSELRVKKNLSKLTGALEAFVAAIEMTQDQNFECCEGVSNPHLASTIDVIPRVPVCFDSGLENR